MSPAAEVARAVPTALVRAPAPALEQAELTFLDRSPVDVAAAQVQHRAYVALLERLGRRVVHVEAAPEHPDGAFVEDAVVVVGDLAVLTRPGAASRRGEVASVERAVVALGLRTARVEGPGTLDGGDVLQVGRTVFVGLGGRTDTVGAEQLRAHLAPLGRRVVTVPVTGCLHLKTGATALPDGTVLAVRHWLDTTVMAAEGLQVIEAPEPAGADVLLVDETVVLSAAAPRTAELVRRRGFAVEPVELSELEKLEAGPTCLSVLLEVPDRTPG